jgi:hypothetical protein
MALSQTDLDVRLQQLGCCIGKEAKKLQQYYAWGSDCVEEQLNKVLLLEAYAEILKCYKVQATSETRWTYVATFDTKDSMSVGDTIEIFGNGLLLLEYTVASTTECTVVTALSNLLAEVSGIGISRPSCGASQITMTFDADCEITPVFIKYTTQEGDISYIPVSVYEEGECESGDDDNCITEDQLNVILENISRLCKVCFQPEGFAYYNQ